MTNLKLIPRTFPLVASGLQDKNCHEMDENALPPRKNSQQLEGKKEGGGKAEPIVQARVLGRRRCRRAMLVETEELIRRQRRLDMQKPVSRRRRRQESKSRGEKWE